MACYEYGPNRGWEPKDGPFIHKRAPLEGLRARPLTLHPHLHLHFHIHNADSDAGTMASGPFKLQIRMKNQAGTAALLHNVDLCRELAISQRTKNFKESTCLRFIEITG